MDKEFGLKELYDLTLKATYPIELGNRKFEPGEVLVRFDKIQMANFREITRRVSANGGYDNRGLVFWEDPTQMQLSFNQGIFSKMQLALLDSSNLICSKPGEEILIPYHQEIESDENGRVSLEKGQIANLFVYDLQSYERINPQQVNLETGEFLIDKPYHMISVDYNYNYKNSVDTLVVGQKLIQGYLQLEGKTRVKDDITGKTRTALLRVPKLKLISDLSMRLGREATPMMANFDALGLPVGQKGSKKIMELLFLEDDIDADM